MRSSLSPKSKTFARKNKKPTSPANLARGLRKSIIESSYVTKHTLPESESRQQQQQQIALKERFAWQVRDILR
jgi:hypothetical protein